MRREDISEENKNSININTFPSRLHGSFFCFIDDEETIRHTEVNACFAWESVSMMNQLRNENE